MAFLGETIKADELPTSDRSYDLIPEGWYAATISKAELGQTKAGTGTKIDIRYDITGPTHEGRVVFASVNIRNQSQKAEEIGRQQLGEIMRAIGLAKVEDTDQLIGGTLQIKVKIRKASESDKANGYGDDRNEIGGWKSASGAAPIPVSRPSSAPAATSAPAGAKPPWAK
jgi:hypothetical protein